MAQKLLFARSMIRTGLAAFFVLGACSGELGATGDGARDRLIAAAPSEVHRFGFDGGDALDPFEAVLGTWSLAHDESAPGGPEVVRQVAELYSPEFPRLILRDLSFKNPRVSVRCKPERGVVDQACGLVLRFRDRDNYYVTRANALEGNVRLYRVVDGIREQFATRDLPIRAGVWHTLSATADGPRLRVSWDDHQVLDAADATFAEGRVGLWTKADAVTAFDDLVVQEL